MPRMVQKSSTYSPNGISCGFEAGAWGEKGLPFQVSKGHGSPQMPVWVVQGSLETWILTTVPTCQRECGCCKCHRRHSSPPSAPAEFPRSGMQSTGRSHSNKGTLTVKGRQQPDPRHASLRLSPGEGTGAQELLPFRLWPLLRGDGEGPVSKRNPWVRKYWVEGPDPSSTSDSENFRCCW